MSRFRMWLIGVVGLLALLVLVVVLAGLFGGLAGPTPGQTTVPTPVVSAATATPPPYPPPSSPAPQPTPPGTPTVAPTPRATPTPIPVVTVVPGPLPPGLKIVCIDQGADEQTSVVWMANVNDLDHAQVIATLRNLLPGGVPLGHLSPSERQIAYILPRKDYYNSVLGIMNMDGSKGATLDDPVDGPGVEWLLRWSPDSQWVAYVRRASPGPESASQIWLIHPDGSGKQLLVPEIRSPLLIGWSRDGSQLYYTPGGRDLWTVSTDGQTPPSVLLHFDESAAPLKLSPDGRKIIYEVREPRPAAPVTLGAASMDGREKYLLAQGINSGGFAFENYVLSPIWSPDSSRIVYNAPVDKTHLELLTVQWNNPQARVVIRDKEMAYYKPISWSPDSQYIAAWRYPLNAGPDSKLDVVLMGLNGSLHPVHSVNPYSPLPTFIGWVQ